MGVTTVVAAVFVMVNLLRRCVLRAARSARAEAMSDTPLAGRRGVGRGGAGCAATGWRPVGAAVIVAVGAARRCSAPLISPYDANIGGRRRAPAAAVVAALAGHRRSSAATSLTRVMLRRAHVADRRLHRGADRRRCSARCWARPPPMRAAGPRKALMRAHRLCSAFRRSSWRWRSPPRWASARATPCIAMLVVWWPKFARLARSLVLAQRSLEYVAAAQAIGFPPDAYPVAPDPAQRGRAADRADHAGSRQRDPGVRRPVVPRPRRRAADAGMGVDGVGGARTGAAMVGRDVSRPGDPDRGDGLQLRGRRPARLARSACQNRR